MAIFLIGTSVSYAKDDQVKLKDMIQETAQSITKISNTSGKNILKNEEIFPPGSSLSDWTAMVLAFSGEKDAYGSYLERLEEYVTEQYEQIGYLDPVKATEYHRVALTVLTLGGDPTEFGKDIDGNPVNLIAEGTYDFHGESPGQQGNNGLIYALLALDSLDYQVPQNSNFTREQFVEELISMQDGDGSITLTANSSGDMDVTAMALQALAKYQEQPEVKEVVDNALSYLSLHMTDNSVFESYENENAESTAQVALALCALGIDPEEDERFIINGTSIFDGLNRFRQEDGSYAHIASDEGGDLMATQQSLLALEAVYRLRQEGTWIFDFTEYEFDETTGINFSLILIGVLIIALVVIVGIITVKRNKQERDRRYV